MARVLCVDSQHPQRAVLDEAVRILAAGGLVAFPTETVYGLGARAYDPRALASVFAAKGRPKHHPLIAHVEDEARARSLARVWPPLASRLARAFWPGPLTLVVERASHVPSAIGGGGLSLAVRVPSHAVALGLIAGLDEPIAAPSANRYQELSPTTADHVIRQLGDAVDLILDGGACDAGVESTVVDVRGVRPRVLRPGALGLEALRAVAGEVEFDADRASPDDGAAPRASPGLDARHYAPRARLKLAASQADAYRLALKLVREGDRVGLVVYGRFDEPPADGVAVRLLASDPVSYAHHFYGVLHELDAAPVDAIVVQRVPESHEWWAIADRLERGASVVAAEPERRPPSR